MPLLETAHPEGIVEPKTIVQKSKSDQHPNGIVNGHANAYTNGETTKTPNNEISDDDFAVLSVRNLLFDVCNQNGGGHGGSAIGMAAIGVALYKYVMRYNPSNPDWFDRDRFVLSNGEFKRAYRDLDRSELMEHRSCCHVSLRNESSRWIRELDDR